MRLSFSILGVLLIAVAGYSDEAAGEAAPVQNVRVIPASTVEFRPTVEITGAVNARVQSELSFRSAGRVTERLVDVGSRVHAGDVLARIDDTEQRADVEVARASLASAQATVRQKQRAFDRNSELLPSGTIARATFDQSQEELRTAQGQLASAQANLGMALDSLAQTELKADADGVVISRAIEVGQVVAAAQTALTLAIDGARDATFNVFEAYFLDGTPSGGVEIHTVADASQKATGSIREISPVIDTSNGTIRVKVSLPPDLQWPLGAPVIGRFHSPPQTGIILPWSAMASAKGNPAVWVVDPSRHSVSLRRVTVSRYRTNDFIVVDGIAPRDLIVSEGGKFLKEGQVVAWEGN